MKVYSCPKQVPAPEPDYRNFDMKKEQALQDKHQEDLKNWLKANGFAGKHTGEIVRFGVADGYAEYMFMDGPKSGLVHLPYGDGYQYRDVSFLPKTEILKRIKQEKEFAKIFSKG
jgi:hypothetical protein